MKITETLNEGLNRSYEILLTAAEIDEKAAAKLTEIAGTASIPGFRPGKVPMSVVKGRFGEQVKGDVIRTSLDDGAKDAIESNGLKLASQPKLDIVSFEDGADLTATLQCEVMPDFSLPDLSALSITRPTLPANEAEVDETMTRLADENRPSILVEKKRKSKMGDIVKMDFTGRVDGTAFEGGAAEGHMLELGSNSFIPGFEEQLIGAKANDAVEVKVTFPADYQAENLAGKDAVFECQVNEVKAPSPAEINDDLATNFGAENLADLKSKITERLQEEYSGAARMVMKRKLMDELAKLVTFELPPTLVENEANSIAHQLWHEDNPEVQGHDHPEIETTQEHTDLAERRVRLGLLLAEIGQQQEITVTDAEIQQAAMQQAQQYPGQERQFFEFLQKNEQMQQQMRAPIFEDKVVDYIIELAEVKEKSTTKEKLQKAVEDLEKDS